MNHEGERGQLRNTNRGHEGTSSASYGAQRRTQGRKGPVTQVMELNLTEDAREREGAVTQAMEHSRGHDKYRTQRGRG